MLDILNRIIAWVVYFKQKTEELESKITEIDKASSMTLQDIEELKTKLDSIELTPTTIPVTERVIGGVV